MRITAKAATESAARSLLDAEEAALREILGELVFAVDDETMEHAVIARLLERQWTIAVGESLTGGLVGSRLSNPPGASKVFRGSIASYATEVKHSVLGVTADRAVSEQSAKEMADGARRLLRADVGISVTGVAGPTEQDGQPIGTVWFGLALPGVPLEAVTARLPGDRDRIRQFSTISLLNLLRMRLDGMR